MYSVFYKFDSRTQTIYTLREPDISLLDGPSTSGVASLACATSVGSAAAAVAGNTTSSAQYLNTHGSPEATSELLNIYENSPTTPNSTTSTAPLMSPPQSPQSVPTEANSSTKPSENNTATMPAKSHQPMPVIVTTTTTAEIMDENRFTLLGKDIITNELDIYSLPSPPNINSQDNLDNSSVTTISQITPSDSPRKTNEFQNGSATNTPLKKNHRNHNNNQGDVNSIESITEDIASVKIPSGDLDWIDSMVQERQDREILAKPKKKKKKKHAKELDQLDGIPMKDLSKDESKEDDDKVVTCLYYTLMCCDCTIS